MGNRGTPLLRHEIPSEDPEERSGHNSRRKELVQGQMQRLAMWEGGGASPSDCLRSQESGKAMPGTSSRGLENEIPSTRV